MTDMIRIDLVIDVIEELRVSGDPGMHKGMACLITFRLEDGGPATIGLRTAAYRTLVHALIEKMPPGDLALGRS